MGINLDDVKNKMNIEMLEDLDVDVAKADEEKPYRRVKTTESKIKKWARIFNLRRKVKSESKKLYNENGNLDAKAIELSTLISNLNFELTGLEESAQVIESRAIKLREGMKNQASKKAAYLYAKSFIGNKDQYGEVSPEEQRMFEENAANYEDNQENEYNEVDPISKDKEVKYVPNEIRGYLAGLTEEQLRRNGIGPNYEILDHDSYNNFIVPMIVTAEKEGTKSHKEGYDRADAAIGQDGKLVKYVPKDIRVYFTGLSDELRKKKGVGSNFEILDNQVYNDYIIPVIMSVEAQAEKSKEKGMLKNSVTYAKEEDKGILSALNEEQLRRNGLGPNYEIIDIDKYHEFIAKVSDASDAQAKDSKEKGMAKASESAKELANKIVEEQIEKIDQATEETQIKFDEFKEEKEQEKEEKSESVNEEEKKELFDRVDDLIAETKEKKETEKISVEDILKDIEEQTARIKEQMEQDAAKIREDIHDKTQKALEEIDNYKFSFQEEKPAKDFDINEERNYSGLPSEVDPEEIVSNYHVETKNVSVAESFNDLIKNMLEQEETNEKAELELKAKEEELERQEAEKKRLEEERQKQEQANREKEEELRKAIEGRQREAEEKNRKQEEEASRLERALSELEREQERLDEELNESRNYAESVENLIKEVKSGRSK